MDAQERKEKTSDRGMVKVVTLKRGTLIGGSLGLDILRALDVEIPQFQGCFICNILKDCILKILKYLETEIFRSSVILISQKPGVFIH